MWSYEVHELCLGIPLETYRVTDANLRHFISLQYGINGHRLIQKGQSLPVK